MSSKPKYKITTTRSPHPIVTDRIDGDPNEWLTGYIVSRQSGKVVPVRVKFRKKHIRTVQEFKA